MNDTTSPIRWQIETQVNGVSHGCSVSPRQSLADFLRDDLNLTGTHVGCEHGVCGACTVLVDGLSTRACLMLAVQADGAEVSTVEGLARIDEDGGNTLSVLQQAFCDNHGLQCGFCTAGILMTLTELLREVPKPGEAQIRAVLSGHICRCTGYNNIVAAALDAVQKLQARKP
ncbi:(2Fe-2S)-binding protein [soil metagenome]